MAINANGTWTLHYSHKAIGGLINGDFAWGNYFLPTKLY